MQDIVLQVEQTLGPLWPVLLFLLLLLVSYVVAKLVSGLVKGALRKTRIDDRLFGSFSKGRPNVSSEGIAGSITFWVVFVLGIIVAFDVVDLTTVSGPLGTFVDQVLGFLPNLIGAAVLAAVAYGIARVLQMITTSALRAANVDERVATAGETGVISGSDALPLSEQTVDSHPAAEVGAGAQADLDEAQARSEARLAGQSPTANASTSRTPLSETLGTAVFYFVILLFLPAILGALELDGILSPVQGLVNEILTFVPNVLLAAIIVIVGAFVARVLRKIVANLTAAAGADRLSERVGLARATGGTKLSDLLGLVVYILVLVPVIVAALQALDVEAVTAPASAMLAQFLEAIPRVFVAALILGIAYVVGRLVASLVSNLLAGVGFDRLFEGLGFRTAAHEATAPADPGEAAEEGQLDTSRPSGIVGIIVLVAVMLFAATEAASALGLEAVALLVAEFTVLAGEILLGLLIFAVGLYLANLAYSTVKASGTSQSDALAVAARVSILVLAGAMALKQMGLADSIVNLAFGLILGAIALAAAIAFGWGGRDAAQRQIEKFQSKAEAGELSAPSAVAPDADQPGATRPDVTTPSSRS